MKQELLQLDELNNDDEFDPYDTYYSKISAFSKMDVIQTLIKDIPNPVFVIESTSREVRSVNTQAELGLIKDTFLGVPFEDLVEVFDDITNQPLAFFNGEWYTLSQDSFLFDKNTYLKIELHKHSDVLNTRSFASKKNMIAVMLHRFRSPLTGVNGYLDLLRDENKQEDISPRISSIQKGIDHLNNIMDELEHLYHISSSFDMDKLEHVDPLQIINSILLSLPEQERTKVHVLKPVENHAFLATQDGLYKVLEALIQNAIEHSQNSSNKVSVSFLSNRIIRISNESRGINSDILKDVFSPFVTTRATNLGIGLTSALLYAKQFNGTIFLTENGENNRVTFTVCFPK
ncbi:MAG: HAMP domain-containing histidine kinase [Balneolales bacterium]|nr:HAMP domain-containing histidine kinase [Balneolales bacterium]